ncbi:lmo0937 family membrane protein [Solitalea canadensis]|uniref:Lmo0937 family membrane protein n=1 Tax=Solitalea canadensis (strain ATCC 29591 / DSM 3403 / JCM 21819 / LMG 8368 / NBRC 15130 / NCIMB 12057 / USAM 9D) TaxID=929556 RepID=H8KQ21_SOLCM|nr:lmo0937 family membrane protein [Solitalea canadensis]AFD06189.1 hypothetical protein Solca_1083 [Solitalea canadensis DSM 3403]
MKTTLNLIAAILLIGWILGITVEGTGKVIHLLLILSIISVALSLFHKTP